MYKHRHHMSKTKGNILNVSSDLGIIAFLDQRIYKNFGLQNL